MRSSMEFHGTVGAPISLTRAIPWNSMELRMRQFRWNEQFHGTPWNLKCANFADMRSSMEFYGFLGAPISLTRAVPWIPWNSMELRVRKFRWPEQFHGIPWNLNFANFADMRSSMEFHGFFGCANFADTSSSMEFHGIPWNLECANFADPSSPWNSMELEVRQFRWHEMFHVIQWNSMELWVRQLRWHGQFHGIPWNIECANCDDMSSSMEFHGTLGAPISLTRAVPWNSMEFHGIRSAPISMTWAVPWNSMELWVRQFR